MKKRREIIIFGLALTLQILLFSSCSGDSDAKKVEALKPVKYSKVILSGGIQKRSFNGITQSGAESKLSFRIGGLITRLKVKAGSRVKRGQLLARIDAKDTKLAYERAKSALNNAKIQLETSKSSLSRIKKLYTSNNASLTDYERAKSSFSVSQSSFQSASRTLELQASQLSYTKITAPTDGIVTSVKSEINEFTAPGAPVLTISSKDELMEVNVGVPELYITKIKQGDFVDINFPSIKNRIYKGVISEVGYSTAEFLTYPVIIKIVDKTTDVRPDMPVNVSFSFGSTEKQEKLAVAVNAVGQDYDGTFVFVLEKKSDHFLVQKRSVEVGAITEQGFEVVSGLKQDEIIAVAGLRSLYTGRKVKLLK